MRAWLFPLGAAAAAIILYVLAAGARASAFGADGADAGAAEVVEQVTEQLGGGPVARYVASRMVRAELVAQENAVE